MRERSCVARLARTSRTLLFCEKTVVSHLKNTQTYTHFSVYKLKESSLISFCLGFKKKAFVKSLALRYVHLCTISHSKRQAGLQKERKQKKMRFSETLLVPLDKHCRSCTGFIEIFIHFLIPSLEFFVAMLVSF